MNNICIVGRMGADPELKYTPSGAPVCSIRVAVNRPFKSKETGEREVDWFSVVAWNKTAEFVANYLSKGRLVSVEGRMQRRDYTDKEGVKRQSWELMCSQINGLDRPRDSEEQDKGDDPAVPGAPFIDPFSEE